MRRALILLVAGTLLSGAAAWAAVVETPAKITLTRLDCGTVAANDLNLFSDSDAYVGKSKRLTVSCYLIRHGDEWMLWDAGLPAAIKGKPIDPKLPMDATVTATIPEHLARLGMKPGQISKLAISHYHFDHIGQAPSFPGATLLIGKQDWAAISATPPEGDIDPTTFKAWLSGGSKVDPVIGDRDVFGDGSVRMIFLPGHTPGHHALLVKLATKGYVLLTGDQAHFTENYVTEGVPGFNTSRGDTMASFKRLKELAHNTRATVVIQHEPADIAKLPAFPAAAE